MDVSPDGSRLAVLSVEGQVWVYALPDVEERIEPTPLSVPPTAPGEVVRASISSRSVSSVEVSPDGSGVFVGTVDGEVASLDASDGSVRWRRVVAKSLIRQIVTEADGTLVIATNADGVRRIRGSDGSEVEVIDPAAAVQVVAPLADRSVIVVDGTRFRRVGAETAWTQTQSNFTLDADVSSDGLLAAFGTNRFAVAVREVASGDLKARLLGHEGFVTSVRFLGRADRIVSGATDGRAMLWDWPSGAVVHQFEVGQSVSAVVPVRQDRLMATTGTDFMKLWDLSSGQLVRTYPASRGIRAASASADGRFIWTAGPGPLVRKWIVPEPPRLD